MTTDTQKLRTFADSLGSNKTPLRVLTAIHAAADHIDAQTAKIAEAESQTGRYRRASERWKKVAESAEERVRDQAAEIARLRGLVAEMAEHDTYETEYDGRMYSICHGCGAQDGEPHRDPNCLYVRAQAALSGESK